MKTLSALSFALLLAVLPSVLQAQQAQDQQYKITKILPALIATPQYQFAGDVRTAPAQNANAKWLEVQVQFQAAPENTDELTFKYYIAVGQAPNLVLLTGEVTHVNVPKSKELYSVMYVSPRTLSRFLGNTVNINAIKAVGVQLLVKGQLVDEMSTGTGANGEWWTAYQQVTGLVLNKSETPFAPLYWDRFEAIKSAH